jgi:hypothetical protein
MGSATASKLSQGLSRLLPPVLVLVTSLATVACDEPPPRTFTDFMEDRIAREGTLARCEQDRTASRGDIECANARRAEAVIALREERERREESERESARKLAVLRRQIEARDEAALRAAAAEEAAKLAAYDAQWKDGAPPGDGAETELGAPGAAEGPLPPVEGSGGAPQAPDFVPPVPIESTVPVASAATPGAVTGVEPDVTSDAAEAPAAPEGQAADLQEVQIPRPFRHD